MELLWQPGQIGPMTTKNRTVRSATNDHLSTRGGALTQDWMDSYVELAKGGVGVIITGQFAMDDTQRGDEGQPVLTATMTPAMLRHSMDILNRTCKQVHEYGAKLVVQLSHTGPKALEQVNGRPPRTPADFTQDELQRMIDAFVYGALTCQVCGVDGVQVHMAHGYLLSSFLDPKQNTRTDEFGGSLENRFRLGGEIIRAIRGCLGDTLALMVKVDSNCCGDLHELLRLCKQAGADCVEISGVDFSARKREGAPFYLEDAVAARQGIDMPIALVGGIHTLEGANAVMEAGIEFASVSRALICEPDLIRKFQSGEKTCGDCVGCNGCFRVFRQRPVRCVLHQTPIPQLEQVFGPYAGK